jgi:dTDP-L-rhamnose 4-epimerase
MTVPSQRVLVTGGAGFIGSTVVDQLVDAGHDTIVVDHLHPRSHRVRPDYLNPGATYVWVGGVDAVCHQAAMVGLGVDFSDVDEYVDHNDMGTARLLRALHDRAFTGRLVLASSMVVYGEGSYRCRTHGPQRPGPRDQGRLDAAMFEPTCETCGVDLIPESVTEDATVDPRNVYAATKLHQEHLFAAYANEHRCSAIALRYHNVYGPRMPRDTPYAGVAAIFRSAAERGVAARVFEDGQQRRDFVHVSDVARANLLALSAPAEVSGAFNVATGDPRTILDMADALTAAVANPPTAVGLASSVRVLPVPPIVVGGARAGDVRHVFACPERAAAALGFRASIGFADGMAGFATDPLRH